MIGERNFSSPCDNHRISKILKMKIMDVSAKHIVEDHGSIIRKLENYYQMCTGLNVEQGSSYEVFLPKKQTKMLFKMV